MDRPATGPRLEASRLSKLQTLKNGDQYLARWEISANQITVNIIK